MPVVLTAAGGPVGNALVAMLRAREAEVRALTASSSDAEEIRRAGAKAAAAGLDDRDVLRAVLDGAHTLCHLGGGALAGSRDGWDQDVEMLLTEAARAGVRRLLLVSAPGASSTSPSLFLRSRGRWEELAREAAPEVLVLRTAPVYGRGAPLLEALLESARSRPVRVAGEGSQRLAPLLSDDLAAVLAAADDRPKAIAGVRGLQGPDVVTADELTDLICGRRRRKRHETALPGLEAEEAEVLSSDILLDAPDVSAELGVALTLLEEGLRIALEG